MPKKIIIESFIHHLATAARTVCQNADNQITKDAFQEHIASWEFEITGSRKIHLTWRSPKEGQKEITIPSLHFYTRGDSESAQAVGSEDSLQAENASFFRSLAQDIFKESFQ